MTRRRRHDWYEPEDLGYEQDAREANVPGRRYYVYVLTTDYGHYVGHSARPRARLREHQDDPHSPVAGGYPEMIWVSRPFATRRDAAGFEAAMKSWRQQRSSRFEEIVGVEPEPFHRPRVLAGGGRGAGGGEGAPPGEDNAAAILVAALLIGVLLMIVLALYASLNGP